MADAIRKVAVVYRRRARHWAPPPTLDLAKHEFDIVPVDTRAFHVLTEAYPALVI